VDVPRSLVAGFFLFWVVQAGLAGSPAVAGDVPAAPPAARFEAALQNVATLDRPDQVGYATIWDGNKYAQCSHLGQGGWRCEAAGARMQPSLVHLLTPERIASLTALGWRPDPAFGNYVQSFGPRAQAADVARVVVRTLSDGYDAATDLEVETTWVAAEPCPPRNGFTQNLAGLINAAPSMAATAVHACAFFPGQIDAPSAELLDNLLSRESPRTTAEIQRLRVNEARDVFVILDAGIGYVQCQPDHAAIICEAQSADSWPALASVLTPERVAKLHAMGFADPGRSPNYSKAYPLQQYDDPAIARELITVLHDVYGYTGVQPLMVTTEDGPMAPPRRDRAPTN
jgi:hypothetical protein